MLVRLPLPQEAKDPVLTLPLAPAIMLGSTCSCYQTAHLRDHPPGPLLPHAACGAGCADP